jgi:hypothetical protein
MDARCFIPPSAGKDCNVLLPVITAPSGNVGEVRFLGLGPFFTLWPLGALAWFLQIVAFQRVMERRGR